MTPAPRNLPQLFDAVPNPRVRALARLGTVRSWRRATVLMEEGDHGNTLLVVLAGRLRAYSSASSGTAAQREVTYGVYGPGDFVGEMSMDGGPRSASVMTVEPTTCSVVTREAVRAYIAEEPEFAFDLLARVIERARRATHTARSLVLTDAYGRLSELLMTLAQPQPDGSLRVAERLTHQDIASRIGCSREMVSRLQKDLQTGGYLAVDATRCFVVLKALPARW
jgi:CRP/FNR family cyclic AMP-dependent transcriptional regulator